jgi:hypothetical protein
VISFPASSGGRRVLLEPRGNRRRDHENILDLRLEKIFKFGTDKNRISLYADITNVFNQSVVTDLQYRVPSRVIGTRHRGLLLAHGAHRPAPDHVRRPLVVLG